MTTIYKVLVCDWDGTIANSMHYKRENICKIFAKYSWSNSKKVSEIHERLTGIPRHELFNEISFQLNRKRLTILEYETLSEKYTALNIESAKKSVGFPDAISLLINLKGKIPIYVSSSAAKKEVELSAKNLKLDNLFKEILGSEPGFSKGPNHINYITELEKVTHNDILFIGDDMKDLVLGELAGVRSLRVVRKAGLLRPNEITSFAAIAQFFKEEL
jgi:phosphoglycolate phosphatase-like HAD superfamily hydrolase